MKQVSTAQTLIPILTFLGGGDFGLQQHVGRGAAGLLADGAGTGRGDRRRSDRAGVVDHRGRTPGRFVAAVDDRRPVHRAGADERGSPGAVQPGLDVGAVDGGGGGAGVLRVLWLAVIGVIVGIPLRGMRPSRGAGRLRSTCRRRTGV